MYCPVAITRVGVVCIHMWGRQNCPPPPPEKLVLVIIHVAEG